MGPPPPSPSSSPSSSSSSRTFRIVSLLTLSLSLLGLCANLIHLGNYHHTTEVDHVSHLPPPLTTLVEKKKKRRVSDVPTSSVRKKEEDGKVNKEEAEESGLNEEEVFKNVLQRSISILEWCNNNNGGVVVETLSSSSERVTGSGDAVVASSSSSLDQFGIINGLTSHLSSSSSSLPNNSDGSEKKACHLPPSKSCHTQTLTVVISTHGNIATSNGTNGLRPLFLLCMKVLTYPFISEIIMIYTWDRETLKMDDKYGQRLLSWDEDSDHPFRLHVISIGEENVSAMARMWSKYSPNLQPQNDALLYLNGDVTASSTFNRKGLLSGLELFRRNSEGILGWGGYRIQQQSSGEGEGRGKSLFDEMQKREMELLVQTAREGGDVSRKEEEKKKRRMLLEDTLERTTKGGDTNTEPPTTMVREKQQQQQQQQGGPKTTNFIPACKNSGPLTYVRQTTAEAAPAESITAPPAPPPAEEYQFYANILPTSHGMILHRSYLCWLSHPMFDNIRNYAATAASVGGATSSSSSSLSSVAESVAVTMLITQLSGGVPIRTYPAKVGNVVADENDENNIVGADKKKTNMLRGKHNGIKTGSRGGRRRLSMLLPAKEGQRQYHNSTSSYYFSPLIPIPSYEPNVLKSNNDKRRRSLTQEKGGINNKEDSNTTTIPTYTDMKSGSTVTLPNEEEQRILTTIIQYFGNYHVGSLGWCLGSTKYERLHGTTRENICLVPNNKEKDDGIINEVPWMTVDGLGYDSC